MDRKARRFGPLRWWEMRQTSTQVWISATTLCVFFFLLNWIPFEQPLFRSLGYGVIEGLPFAAITVWATHAEYQSRLRREREAAAEADGRSRARTAADVEPDPDAQPIDPELEAWVERESRR